MNNTSNTDYYLDFSNFTDRLRGELKEHGKLIVAYDFDDTIYDYHSKGRTYTKVINLLKRIHGLNIGIFVCYSCSEESRYPSIHNYLDENNIPCDAINSNPIGLKLPKGGKPYYNVLLDDRAGMTMAYNALNMICSEVECIREMMNTMSNYKFSFETIPNILSDQDIQKSIDKILATSYEQFGIPCDLLRGPQAIVTLNHDGCDDI